MIFCCLWLACLICDGQSNCEAPLVHRPACMTTLDMICTLSAGPQHGLVHSLTSCTALRDARPAQSQASKDQHAEGSVSLCQEQPGICQGYTANLHSSGCLRSGLLMLITLSFGSSPEAASACWWPASGGLQQILSALPAHALPTQGQSCRGSGEPPEGARLRMLMRTGVSLWRWWAHSQVDSQAHAKRRIQVLFF